MTTPSTDWKEQIAPDEAATFERLAQDLAGVQARAAAKRGSISRGLHAKQNVVAKASLEVLPNLPAHARVGLFAEPKTYEAVVRFSNGDPNHRRDKTPDVRGIAVKVMGVGGRKLIPGMERAATQDFLAILAESQPFRTPEDFVWFVTVMHNPLTMLPKAALRFGIGPLLRILKRIKASLDAPLLPLWSNRYFSVLPIRCGAYAVKYSFAPLDAGDGAALDPDLGGALGKRLAQGPVRWELQLQFFTDEQRTPIEDPTVDWQGPWVPVARLTLPQQDVAAEEGTKLAAWAESLSFDPWHAQEELRPLGAFMRARSAAYRVSGQARKASPEPAALPR
jgi:hypothetical protein